MADAVADEYGFKNIGKLKVYLCVYMYIAISIFIKISAEREFYHFELSEIEQSTMRRNSPYTSKTRDLLSKSNVSI